MSLKIIPPQQIFYDKDGTPLDGGYIYIGEVNQNPETHNVPVFWDAELTQPAPQPIRTLNGYPSRQGIIASIFTNAAFSITIRNKRHELVFYSTHGSSDGGAYSLLVFPDVSSAESAAATLPNGQPMMVEGVSVGHAIGGMYVVDTGVPVNTMGSYAELEAYSGKQSQILFITPGIYGPVYRDDADTTSSANGGTIFVDALNRRWKRPPSGVVNVTWFEPPNFLGNGSGDDRPAFQAAADAVSSSALTAKLYIPNPRVKYSFKSKHSSGHGVVFSSSAPTIIGESYVQIQADIAMDRMFSFGGGNTNFTTIENIIFLCNNLANTGMRPDIQGSSLKMKTVLAYNAVQDGLTIDWYESVIELSGGFQCAGRGTRVKAGTTSLVMIQQKSGGNTGAGIYLEQANYCVLIAPYCDVGSLGIEIGDGSGFRSNSITIIEPGFENVGKCIKATNAAIDIIGGTILAPATADYRYDFTDCDVRTSFRTPRNGNLKGTTNTYKSTRGSLTFSVPMDWRQVDTNSQTAQVTQSSVKPKTIYINESGGNDNNGGDTLGSAVATWGRVADIIGSKVMDFVEVVVTNSTSPAIDIGGFTSSGAGIVVVHPLTSCTAGTINIHDTQGGSSGNSVLVQGFAVSTSVTIKASENFKLENLTFASGTNAITVQNSQGEVKTCNAATVNNFIIGSVGSNVHCANNTGSATNTAFFVERGGRVTREGTQPTGATQVVTGGQLI